MIAIIGTMLGIVLGFILGQNSRKRGNMTNEELKKMKYRVCCPLCDNDKCVKGTDKCEAEMWEKTRKHEKRNSNP